MNREDLKSYRHNQEWIKGRIEYIEQYKMSINKLNSILSDMPKGSREVQDSEAEKLAILIDSVNDLLDKVNEVNKKQTQILQQLDKIKQPYKNILDKYYIQGKSLVVIAAEMGYNYEHIKRLHGIALNIFDQME
jgi:DNA-directed RNA polymerase specialized sigma subunit